MPGRRAHCGAFIFHVVPPFTHVAPCVIRPSAQHTLHVMFHTFQKSEVLLLVVSHRETRAAGYLRRMDASVEQYKRILTLLSKSSVSAAAPPLRVMERTACRSSYRRGDEWAIGSQTWFGWTVEPVQWPGVQALFDNFNTSSIVLYSCTCTCALHSQELSLDRWEDADNTLGC